MNVPADILWLYGEIFAVLVFATGIGLVLAATVRREAARAGIANLNRRIWAWWPMAALVATAAFAGLGTTAILFAVLSFLALREFLGITRTRLADHRTLFWAFFVLIPLQYLLVWVDWHGFFVVFIPVWAFVVFSVFATLRGDPTRFLERVAKIQWGLMVTVYFPSHIPSMLNLEIAGYDGSFARLLLFLVAVSQLNDVLQFVWGKLLGRHRITPHLSPNKTWEGFLGGLASSAGLGAALWWLTPFTPDQAAIMGLVIAACGFAGDIVMSAIKRDAGIKDYGHLIAGHGGILDRIDGLCFAAPVFFHLVRFYFT